MKKSLLKLFSFAAFCLLLTSSSSKASSYIIEASDFQFSPDTLNVLVGDTITWVWLNGNHTITSNGIPDGTIPFNELLDSLHTSFTYIITAEGTYKYISVPDLPGMQGEIVATYNVGISSPSSSTIDFTILSNIVHDNVILKFSIPSTGTVDIVMYDVLGRRLQTFLQQNISAGQYERDFYFREKFPSGLYFVSMHYDHLIVTKRIFIE